ncbi:hypothetical protein ACN28C_05220 [Plantactinospora sp. WMMC1484]|uniref:hypothetical protein n=1 Tax=Plantactinospora sp. WMMC1484 TaxID=3404122 RepID=UPI003BF579AD
MAARGWGVSVATAIGVGAGAGAAQLGFGYGLGIIAWLPSAGGTSAAAWVASLTWAAWVAATSTVAGAICAHRLGAGGRTSAAPAARTGEPPPTLATFVWRAALAVSSAIGALITVLLVAVPARAAVPADTTSPQAVAAGYAVLGVILGLVMAIWAISSPAVARNVIGTVCWLWALAVIAVVDGVLSGRGLGAAQLGVWQLTSDGERYWFREYFYWPGAALSLGSALVIGALAARTAARAPVTRVGAAISGISGPLLVAVAYFLAAPRLVGIRPEQVSAHLMAPYAVVAGLAGSALVAALAQRSEALAAQADSPDSRSDPLPAGARPSETEPSHAEPTGTESTGTEPTRTERQDAGAAARSGNSDAGATADSGRGRLPGQPTDGARRNADEADTVRVRSTAGSGRRPDSGTAGRPTPVASASGATRASGATTADDAADETEPAGSGEPAEPAGEDRPKGSRLGKLGRRSR